MIFLGVLGYGQKDAISFLFGDNDDSDQHIDYVVLLVILSWFLFNKDKEPSLKTQRNKKTERNTQRMHCGFPRSFWQSS